jgi:uncharacterized membrane protein YqjE
VASQVHEKSLGMVVAELKVELRDFVQTRLTMLREEMKTKLGMIKLIIPMAVVALILAAVGFLCITALFVVLIASAFQGVAGFAWAFLIVGVVYFLVAGICAFFAYSELSRKGLAPKHTMQVIKQDQIWLRNEARSQV